MIEITCACGKCMGRPSKVMEMAFKYRLHPHDFIMRVDGRCEWICQHGVGHTVAVPENKDSDAWWIHGCDGCCYKLKEIKKEKKKNKGA